MSGLEHLLAQATPGPWTVSYGESTGEPRLSLWGQGLCLADDSFYYGRREDYELIALAPDAVRLLLDMAAHLQAEENDLCRDDFYSDTESRQELLARFAALDQRAGTA